MGKAIQLSKVAKYSKKRIDADKVSLENFVTIDNILQNKAGITTATNLPPSTNAMPAYEAGHILVGNIRPYLKKIWFANREGGCSADVLNFEVNKGYDSKFVYYSMFRDDFFNHMMKGAKGTKMPRGDKNQILEFLIPDFDFPTQQKIAAVLSALDAKIELNQRINAELESMAKTLYDYWFVQFDFPNEKGKPYKSAGGKMVWNEELKREIPLGWSSVMVGEILGKEPKTKKILNSDILPIGTIPVIDQSADFIAGFTDDKNGLIKITEPRIIFGDHTRILKLINFDFARGADGTQVLLSNTNRLPQHLLYHTLLKIDLSNYGYARHFKFLKETRIILPDEKISRDFEGIAKSYYDVIKHNIFENLVLTELRGWLLPMLMNGQVTVV
jgi:type I restriction enzyme S subunit